MSQFKKQLEAMAKVLVIVDPQNDFCEGGSLAVRGSNEIFTYINSLKNHEMFQHVIITRDWHPQGHISFANRHNKEPFTSLEMNGKVYELWPEHCVAGTKGAEFSPLLNRNGQEIIISKGIFSNKQAYSGFYKGHAENDLFQRIKDLQCEEVYVCGLAFDFCVGKTALDSKKLGFKTFVIEEATRSVSVQTAKKMKNELIEAGVKLLSERLMD